MIPAFSQIFQGHPILHVQEVYAQGINGPVLLGSPGDNRRDMNTVVRNDISGVNLNANGTIDFPPGLYFATASAAGHQVEGHKVWLYNVTDLANLIAPGFTGLVAHASAQDWGQNIVHVAGEFELSATKTIDLQHTISSPAPNSGPGGGKAMGRYSEVFAEIMVWQIRAG